MTSPSVSIITASTGKQHLKDCLESVSNQTHTNIHHLVFCDGPQHIEQFNEVFDSSKDSRRDVIYLPYSTGNNRWNGHRMYAAGTYLTESDFIMFLDDDNFIDPTHVEECIKACEGVDWSFSLRKIVDKDRNFICNDDCENLGKWPSVLNENDYFVDVNCYFLRRLPAIIISPIWWRKFREPNVVEIDRAIIQGLRSAAPNYECTRNYTVNYTVGNTELSVKPEFFIKGNEEMLRRYDGRLPWKQPKDVITLNF